MNYSEISTVWACEKVVLKTGSTVFQAAFLYCCPDCPSWTVNAIQMNWTTWQSGQHKEIQPYLIGPTYNKRRNTRASWSRYCRWCCRRCCSRCQRRCRCSFRCSCVCLLHNWAFAAAIYEHISTTIACQTDQLYYGITQGAGWSKGAFIQKFQVKFLHLCTQLFCKDFC